MKQVVLLLIIMSYQTHILAQDVIIKRSAFGTLEIFRSSHGIATGLPIGKISKSPLGYLHIEDLERGANISQSLRPYDNRPQLTAVKPFMAPTTKILNTFNTYLGVIKEQEKIASQNKHDDGTSNLRAMFTEMQGKYDDLLKFYNEVQNKPKHVNDGWHNVALISKNPIKDITGGEIMVKTGYAYVSNNKPASLIANDYTGGTTFETNKITGGIILDCKAYYRTGNTGSYNNEMYFLDYILDTSLRASVPPIGIVYFNPDARSEVTLVGIYKRDPKTFGETGDNMMGVVVVGRDSEGNVVPTNYYSSYPGFYYYKAVDKTNRILYGTFTLTKESQATLNLNY